MECRDHTCTPSCFDFIPPASTRRATPPPNHSSVPVITPRSVDPDGIRSKGHSARPFRGRPQTSGKPTRCLIAQRPQASTERWQYAPTACCSSGGRLSGWPSAGDESLTEEFKPWGCSDAVRFCARINPAQGTRPELLEELLDPAFIAMRTQVGHFLSYNRRRSPDGMRAAHPCS